MGDPKKEEPPTEPPKLHWKDVGATIKNCTVIRFPPGKWTETGPDARGCYTYEANEDNAEFSAQVGATDIEIFRAKEKNSKVQVCGTILHIPNDGFQEK